MSEIMETIWGVVWSLEMAYITFLLVMGVTAVLVMGVNQK